MNKLKMMSATLGMLSAILTPSMRADEANKTTYITTHQPLQVQDTLLAPGRYMFKMAGPNYDGHTVQIYNADGTRLEATIQANSAYRSVPSGTTQFTISDPQGGQPAMLRSWFYPGDNVGLDFGTPKGAGVNTQKGDRKGKAQNVGQPAGDVTSTRD